MLGYPEPTAEQVVQAVEAAYLFREQASLENIARFMGLDFTNTYQRQQVEHSLFAARELRLLTPNPNSNAYTFSLLVPLMVKAKEEDKRIIFRVHLNQFPPFRLFLERLLTGILPQEATRQACAVYNTFASDYSVAWRAFESWGTYAGVLTRAQTGRYVPTIENELHSLRQTLDTLSAQEQEIREYILNHLGSDAYHFIEGQVRDNLITAMTSFVNENPVDSIILQSANTFEDFLRKVGETRGINLNNAHGIIQLGNSLRSAGAISVKHLGIIQMIGQIRNASDHGGDPNEGNRRWNISRTSALLMLDVMLMSIRSIVSYVNSSTLEI